MLKTVVDGDVWLVHQPDHARVSGYLAAHWGGANEFARPGRFAPFERPEALRQAVVHAVAEHDSGWWEWEASPLIGPADGLPASLQELGRDHPDDALRRWRIGVPRLAEAHPYSALLASLHAHWLYTFAADPAEASNDEAFRHPIFGGIFSTGGRALPGPDATRAFLAEQHDVRQFLRRRLREQTDWAAALDDAHLHPHLRLLQVLDALSLYLSFGGRRPVTVAHVPRRDWTDRCSVDWEPGADRRIVCDPYPFDTDPLEVFLPVRVIPAGSRPADGGLPLTRLHSIPLQTVRFELTARR